MLCFEGKPEVMISFENENQSPHVDTKLISEIVRRCLSAAVTNVSLAKLKEHSLVNKVTVNGNERVPIILADVKQSQVKL